MSDVANNGLSNCLTKDGQSTPTNNIPLAGFQLTNVGNATTRGAAPNAGQIQDGSLLTLGSVSGTDTITATTTPAITAYAAGQQFRFVAVGANTTSTVTLNINSIGAKNVTQLGASTLQPGMIQAGAVVTVTYDGTQFQAIGINNGANVVGNMRNGRMLVTAAGVSGTFTADELIVETALGGITYKLSSYSQAINLSTTGAGGMDTGSAPISGFVALYAIFNPTTGAASILATNAATLQGNVYGGANMPSGYTASALVAVWPTNASRQFIAGFQNDRKFSMALVTVLTTTATTTGLPLSISSAVPQNAKTVSVGVNISASGGTSVSVGATVSANSGLLGQQFVQSAANQVTQIVGWTNAIPLIVAQQIFYSFVTSGASTNTLNLYVTEYTI